MVNCSLLQVHKTLWNEILQRGSLDVDQLSDGSNDDSWHGFLAGAEVCSAVDNFAQVINRFHIPPVYVISCQQAIPVRITDA